MNSLQIRQHKERGRGWYTTQSVQQGACLLEDHANLCVKISSYDIFSSKKFDLCSQCYSPFKIEEKYLLGKDDCSCAYDGHDVSFCSQSCSQIYKKASTSLCELQKTESLTEEDCHPCTRLKDSVAEVRLAILCLVNSKSKKGDQDILNKLQDTCASDQLQNELIQNHKKEFEQLRRILVTFDKDSLIDAERYLCVVLLNSFGLRLNFLDSNPFALALFGHKISFLNHSCGPNGHYVFDGRILRIHAARNLTNDEELTIPFITGLEAIPKDERRISIRRNLHFDCHCDRCMLDDYADLDYLLTTRMHQLESHEKLWNLAETLYAKALGTEELKVAWKFYTRIIEDYVIKTDAYHPFDPISLRRLDRLVSLCWIFTSFSFCCSQDEWRASKVTSKALDVAQRLAKSGLLDNTNTLEWRYSLFDFAFRFSSKSKYGPHSSEGTRNCKHDECARLLSRQEKLDDRILDDLTRDGPRLAAMSQLMFGKEDPLRAFRKPGLVDNRLNSISKFIAEFLKTTT